MTLPSGTLYITDKTHDDTKRRAWEHETAEWDEYWPSLKETRRRIKEAYKDYDPLVTREFNPMRDAWNWTTFLTVGGQTIRLDAWAPNLAVEDAAVDPEVVPEAYAELLAYHGIVL